MDVLNKYIETTLIVKNSRFINELFPCDAQSQARDIIKSQKIKYADASHVVHAFIIGKAAEVFGMSDAGEPSGTAGRPMLDVLKGSGITNVLLTVTRYFGGTLLGTGGLVKAYGDCAKLVIEQAHQQNAIEELELKNSFSFSVDYQLYETVKHSFLAFKIFNLHENFDSSVEITGEIIQDEYEVFKDKIKNLSSGKIILQ